MRENKKNKMKRRLINFLIVFNIACSCNNYSKETSENDTIKIDSVNINVERTAESFAGNSYNLGNYHNIEFRTTSNYFIYQKPANCGGYGEWSINNGSIILGPNSSNCEGTRAMAGTYDFFNFE